MTGYYRRFINGYELIATPLTHMLKKNEFEWTDEAVQAFTTLKQSLVNDFMFFLPDFSKVFVVETDVCELGFDVVLS